MEKTWREFAVSTGDQVVKTQKRHRKAQRTLTLFVYVALNDLREDAAALGIYVYHVVLEAFQSAHLKRRPVRKPQIERAWTDWPDDLAKDPETAIKLSPEPYVLRYAYEALMEDDDEVVLSEYEFEHIFKLIGIATDCLHQAAR